MHQDHVGVDIIHVKWREKSNTVLFNNTPLLSNLPDNSCHIVSLREIKCRFWMQVSNICWTHSDELIASFVFIQWVMKTASSLEWPVHRVGKFQNAPRQHYCVLSTLRERVVLGHLHLQFGKRKNCKVEVQSLSPRERKPKLIDSLVSNKYRLGLLENGTHHTWSLSWEDHTLRTQQDRLMRLGTTSENSFR